MRNKSFSWNELEKAVEERMSPDRFMHTQRVVACASELAKRWNVDQHKARLAALLHDIAKDYLDDQLLNAARDFGIVLTEIERLSPSLLHGPVGAEIASRTFGVTDSDVLAAIRYHTTGRAGMSRLERVIFLADLIEPKRRFPGVDDLRAAAEQDLDKALLLAFDRTILYLVEAGKCLDPKAVEARNDLLMGRG